MRREHPQRGVGDALVEVADQHRAPRRDRPSGRRSPPGTRRRGHAARPAAPPRPARRGRRPASIQPTGGRGRPAASVAPGVGGRREARSSSAVSSSSAIRQRFPRISANRAAIVTSVGTAVVGGQPHAGVHGRPAAAPTVVVEHVHAASARQAGHVAAAVVDAEPEPAGQRGQRGLAPDRGVQVGHPRPHVGDAADAPRQRRRDDVAHPLMRGRRQQARGRRLPRRRAAGVADRRGSGCCRARSVPSPGSRTRSAALRQRLQLRGGDHAAGQPDPGQRAVGGLVHLQRARAGVVVAGPGHQLTVRPPDRPSPERGWLLPVAGASGRRPRGYVRRHRFSR